MAEHLTKCIYLGNAADYFTRIDNDQGWSDLFNANQQSDWSVGNWAAWYASGVKLPKPIAQPNVAMNKWESRPFIDTWLFGLTQLLTCPRSFTDERLNPTLSDPGSEYDPHVPGSYVQYVSKTAVMLLGPKFTLDDLAATIAPFWQQLFLSDWTDTALADGVVQVVLNPSTTPWLDFPLVVPQSSSSTPPTFREAFESQNLAIMKIIVACWHCYILHSRRRIGFDHVTNNVLQAYMDAIETGSLPQVQICLGYTIGPAVDTIAPEGYAWSSADSSDPAVRGLLRLRDHKIVEAAPEFRIAPTTATLGYSTFILDTLMPDNLSGVISVAKMKNKKIQSGHKWDVTYKFDQTLRLAWPSGAGLAAEIAADAEDWDADYGLALTDFCDPSNDLVFHDEKTGRDLYRSSKSIGLDPEVAPFPGGWKRFLSDAPFNGGNGNWIDTYHWRDAASHDYVIGDGNRILDSYPVDANSRSLTPRSIARAIASLILRIGEEKNLVKAELEYADPQNANDPPPEPTLLEKFLSLLKKYFWVGVLLVLLLIVVFKLMK